jgi:FtsZ-interacting cell division protein ZipA
MIVRGERSVDFLFVIGMFVIIGIIARGFWDAS